MRTGTQRNPYCIEKKGSDRTAERGWNVGKTGFSFIFAAAAVYGRPCAEAERTGARGGGPTPRGGRAGIRGPVLARAAPARLSRPGGSTTT